jgi:hypothetical protein
VGHHAKRPLHQKRNRFLSSRVTAVATWYWHHRKIIILNWIPTGQVVVSGMQQMLTTKMAAWLFCMAILPKRDVSLKQPELILQFFILQGKQSFRFTGGCR